MLSLSPTHCLAHDRHSIFIEWMDGLMRLKNVLLIFGMFDKMKEPYSAPNKNHKEMHGENHSKKVGSQNWYKDVVVSLV